MRKSGPAGSQPFNRQNAAHVVRHAPQATTGGRRHGNVVFLVGGGRNAVDARRVRQRFVFAGQRCGGHRAIMKPEFTPPFSTRTVAAATCACPSSARCGVRTANRFRQTPGGYRRPSPPVRHGSCRRTARHPVRRTPAGYRRRRWLHLQHLGGLADLRQAGAHHLRLAAQGVRILHFFAVAVRVGDFAARTEQVAVGEGGVDLAALAAHLMDTRIERAAGAQRRFHRQAACHGRGGEQVFRVEQAAQREGGGDLSAVQQRQALFRRQRQRFQTGLGQRFGRRQPLALMTRRPSPSSTSSCAPAAPSPEAPTEPFSGICG